MYGVVCTKVFLLRPASFFFTCLQWGGCVLTLCYKCQQCDEALSVHPAGFFWWPRVKKCSDGFVYFISEQKKKKRFSYWTVLTSQSPQVQINNAAELCIIIQGAYVWCLSRVVFQWLRAQTVLARPSWFSLLRGNWIAQGCNSIELEECWAAGK